MTFKKLFIFFSFFLLLISVASGTTVFSENFNYGTTFANTGYSYLEGGLNCFINTPSMNQTAPYHQMFSVNGTTTNCGGSRLINRNFSTTDMRLGIMEISFIAFTNSTAGLDSETNIGMFLGFTHVGTSFKNASYLISLFGDYSFKIAPQSATVTGGTSCTVSAIANGWHTYLIHFDFPNSEYYAIIDGTLYCDHYSTGTPRAAIYGFQLFNQWNQNFIYQNNLDNLLFTSGVSTGENNTPVGKPCSVNTDCATNNCVGGTCLYKSGGVSCADDGECLSGDCFNDVCVNSGVWSEIDQLVSTSVAPDSNSKFFIVLVIMLLTLGLIIWGLRDYIKVAMAISSVLLVLELFFFTVVGWVSAWILILGVVVGIIGAVVLVFLKSSGG